MDGEPSLEAPPRRRFDAQGLNALIQTLAICGAGAWGVYTFIYEARIKPSFEPPTVSVTTALEKAGERNDRVAIRSTVTRKNVGRTGVRVLGLAYNVIGVRARFGEAGAAITPFGGSGGGQIAAARGYTLGEPGTVILHQGVLFAGATDPPAEPSDLNPGEAVSRDLIVYADRTQYDFVRFEVSLAYTKEDDAPVRLRLAIGERDLLALKPDLDCRKTPEPCKRLKTTDFATEFSLW